MAAAAGIAVAITGLAALLQWIWAGWSVYSGAGPAVPERWLLTGAVGAALLLPPGAAVRNPFFFVALLAVYEAFENLAPAASVFNSLRSFVSKCGVLRAWVR